MRPPIPEELQAQIQMIDRLSQWERAQLGRSLRRCGWTYGEIATVISSAKSTIAHWCRDIPVTAEQAAAIRTRTRSQRGIPRDTQHARRAERARIKEAARADAGSRIGDADWLAGVVLYWAEGFKTENALGMANSDAHVLRTFVNWTRTYIEESAVFVASLNLHAGNDEVAARHHWGVELNLSAEQFRKTYVKPDGTGHRRNRLPHGVAQVRMRRSTDAFLCVEGWIDGLRDVWKLTERPD